MLELLIQDVNGEIKAQHRGNDCAYLGYKGTYNVGDKIIIKNDSADKDYLMVKLDASLDTTFIYMPGAEWHYTIPEVHDRTAYYPFSFKGERHYIEVRYAKEYEIYQYRNLALNPHDQKEDTGVYPHASANVETRNETVFFARNAIDGVLANDYHGRYPFQSWGINRQEDAYLKLEFGRPVNIDTIELVLRGDYPHDSYWTEASLEFSDGTEEKVLLDKLLTPQLMSIQKENIEWLILKDLIKHEDESPFPALTQLKVFGTEGF
ncbi:carbohydrate-binding protein [Vagococcus humatus]|uniref:Carbohydrate-binding protein n=1 Tax=Vagococcus humatus TaxID=1889241 RepID=A0A429Z640_9ENTE|nr:carbohydrate-binding protein [Vagococcus humatus]RST89156.1 carbohydrate-binding protein [Vagococcus humatus]